MDDADWAARRALAPADSKAATAGHLESCSPHTTMARADAVVRRRRFDVDDVLPLLIPAIALLTTSTRRRDPSRHYDAWHACVLTGCPDFPQANEAHSFPYLATFVSMLFLFGIMMDQRALQTRASARRPRSFLSAVGPAVRASL